MQIFFVFRVSLRPSTQYVPSLFERTENDLCETDKVRDIENQYVKINRKMVNTVNLIRLYEY